MQLELKMKQMKIERILIPSDFSEHALKALKYGIELARELDAEIVLLALA
jgi:hypothetical protein